MRNSFVLLCVVLLVEGVSVDADVQVQMVKGDTVILKPDDNVTFEKDNWLMWNFNGIIISKMKKTAEDFSIIPDFVLDEKFRGRLEPDRTSGSLKITNLSTEHAGRYQAVMKTKTETFKNYNVTVIGVESISVWEGDFVTLHTGFTEIKRDQIQWMFGNRILITDDVDYTIRNIQRNQSGDYHVKIHTSSIILHRKFSITVNGGERTFSVMEEQHITLGTGFIEIQGYDQILWEFEGQIIAEINREKNLLLEHDSGVERLKGRLQLDKKSGSLTISKTKSTDSGVYHLQMSSSSHMLQRNIYVTVSESSGAVSGIYSASFGLVVWAVAVSLLQV